jgi:hypothetical protein
MGELEKILGPLAAGATETEIVVVSGDEAGSAELGTRGPLFNSKRRSWF